ncbi:MAG: periplasmic nitrate reductase electron transfer subunit [endosymbiont of Galathealinum brachiosum]|uniref:Periplasmic nitrate reductase, electron transfer subunit n=1 Tax=endosymbiont of Galathealinum brachiosum TaxID=2200906 RepID=A0A370D9Z2_9GAMM|nr:MAG: periplasmic nitrate reductase electron transfer subunit [endosymbiont of Galathealinum brachiosum]
MKNSILAGLILMGSSVLISTTSGASGVTSLRGASDIEANSNEIVVKKNINDQAPIIRDYVQQPPLIPHKTKGYKINMKFNKCLTCHSWANYRKAGATKVSQTHFSGRDGEAMSNIAPRRYFCNQCHVPQADAKPLVENSFQPVKTIH